MASPRLLLPLLASLLIVATAAVAAADNPGNRLKQSAEELGRVREKIQAANRAIERAKASQSAEREAVEAAERRIIETQAQLRRVSVQVETQEAHVRTAEAGRAAAEHRLDAERDLLRRQLRSAYVIGQSGRTQLLLSQQAPDRAERLLTYFDYLNRASARHIEAIHTELETVRAEQQKVEAELKTLRDVESARRRRLAELEADRAARSVAIARLEQKISGDAQELKQLQDSEQALQSLMKQLRDALAAAPPVRPSGPQKAFPEMRGKLSWPLHGEILARYGDPKADSRLQWKGLWIAANEGAPVHASAAGRVAYTGWLSSYGLIVVIEHEKGFFTLYGHNASVSAEVGERVAAGDVIAAVGNTGGYERHGLYFEVRKGTDPLDPTDWLGR
ncbi:MAG: peptidoglycan DD-metalloendopeptidase family protein [Nevskia sp.]